MKTTIKKIIKYLMPYGIIILIKNFLKWFLVNFRHSSVRENSVLLVELLPFHGECLPGLTKYLLDLRYNVDVAFNMEDGRRNDLGLFLCFNRDNRLRIKPMPSFIINSLLRSSIATKYRHIIFGSFYDPMERNGLYKVDLFKLKPVCVMHNPDITNAYFDTRKKIISLVNMYSINRQNPLIVNSHYFGEFPKKEKSEITTFAALNSSSLFCRNMYLLFDACDRLFEKGINNFSVKIIGNGIKIPDRFHDKFQIFGFLDFQKMYKEIHASDFILALIDQVSVQYTNKASGSYALSYGFLKPIILHSNFSAVSGFNTENSVLYNNNDQLFETMEKCISMSKNDYFSLVQRLEISEKLLYNDSLNNLKEALVATT